MTTETPPPGDGAHSGFESYLAAMEDQGAPILGYLVLYSVFDGRVTPDQLELWFIQLGLDKAFLPPPIRPVDAYEKVTGEVRHVYRPGDEPGARRQRRRAGEQVREATLMVRPVRSDQGEIVRHLVREVRDGENTSLSYDVHLATLAFRRDSAEDAGPGAGLLQVTPDRAAIDSLDIQERAEVYTVLQQIQDEYQARCRYLTGDRLRTLIRTYVEALAAIRVRPTGGVYFVHRAHVRTLGALRDLVSEFGAGSHLARIPLPDQDEMREMIITAFTTKARQDLERLAADLAAARAEPEPNPAAVMKLQRRYQALKAATAEHSELLSTSLDETEGALDLVSKQLAALLTG